MKIDPVIISFLALVVSALSLAISIYRAGMDRRLQWEQLRGGVVVRLTARGVEVLSLIDTLLLIPSSEKTDLAKKLTRIAQVLVDMRLSLSGMEVPPPLSTAKLLTRFAPIKSRIDDADVIFEKLESAVGKADLDEAVTAADGLIERLYGSRNATA